MPKPRTKTKKGSLLDKSVTLNIRITVPSVSAILAGILTLIVRYQIPFGSTRTYIRRQMGFLVLFSAAMCISLVVEERTRRYTSPLSEHGPWIAIYVGMFTATGISAFVYWLRLGTFDRTTEFYLRMLTFALALSASLGWGALTVLSVIVYTHEWVRVVPWVFIVVYLGRILATYIDFIDLRAVDEMKAQLRDT